VGETFVSGMVNNIVAAVTVAKALESVDLTNSSNGGIYLIDENIREDEGLKQRVDLQRSVAEI
jgi:hypothetical protein